jgi:alkanesulfonate monooxygenase SsuD/methylene tetrahydromethanopterin reductase-like flavin-dependent oxidoreductase (luciferase family)
MADGTIGVQVVARDAAGIVDGIVHAEEMGIPAAWLTTGGTAPDALTVFAAAAMRTNRILMGTSIVPTYPRHPIAVVQQTVALASLAPGRFRLGVGMFGIPFQRPLAHLRAYLKVLKGLLQEGAADVDEAGIVAHARLAGPPPNVPVMASALQRRSFELCGEAADGAITWICPASYVRDVALPALRAGAERAGRPAPPMVMHVPVCVTEDAGAVREAVRAQYGGYLRTISYPAMLAAAGFPEAQQGQWSDAAIDAVVVHGPEATVAERLRGLIALGVREIIASPIGAGADPAATVQRTLRLVADLAKTPA